MSLGPEPAEVAEPVVAAEPVAQPAMAGNVVGGDQDEVGSVVAEAGDNVTGPWLMSSVQRQSLCTRSAMSPDIRAVSLTIWVKRCPRLMDFNSVSIGPGRQLGSRSWNPSSGIAFAKAKMRINRLLTSVGAPVPM